MSIWTVVAFHGLLTVLAVLVPEEDETFLTGPVAESDVGLALGVVVLLGAVLFYFGAYIAAAVCFVRWQSAVSKFTAERSNGGYRHSLSRMIAEWAVPIWNLFAPHRRFRELEAANGSAEQSSIISNWWTAYIAMLILGRVSEKIDSAPLYFFEFVVVVVAAFAAGRMIDHMQSLHASFVTAKSAEVFS